MCRNLRKTLERVLDILMAAMMAIMAIFVFLNVILRYGFNSGLSGTEDVSRLLFVWVSFMGAVAAMSKRGHLSVDMVLRRLSGHGKRLIGLLGRLVMLGALGVMFVGCWQQMILN
ncbi:MAG TPA: TRAP transporter small permease, partial [Burkholderiaceae bacterium]|nr:TRAP transporter small permease [Burkholderiaceae bacterium]